MESANFDDYEKTLAEQQFLGGQQPTSADKEAYDQVKTSAPSAETHPHTFAWFALVSRFSDAVRNSWAAPAAPAKAKAAPAKKEEPKKEAAPADDELDLFGDSGPTEEEQKLLDEQKKQAEQAKAAKAKPALIAKSLILFDVKPYEAETDLDALFTKIMAVQMDGLIWKQDYKKEPIAFGVHKLVVGCVIEDAKVSVDDLQEAIQAFEDDVQSCDIAVFNKI